MSRVESFDFVVLGGGPAGQKAAVQAAKCGRSVLVVDREAGVGGECVRRGTIPSKTLRETAVYLRGLSRRAGDVLPCRLGPQTTVESLMRRLGQVLNAHERFLGAQLARNDIAFWHGRARFRSPYEVEVCCIDGSRRLARAKWIVVATGSRPRNPPHLTIDHERVLDSDSILSLAYLPESLLVLGGGVIASEFASIFQALGVRVTMIDSHDRPLGFLDPDLSEGFTRTFESEGGRFVPRRKVEELFLTRGGSVSVLLGGGERVTAEKALVALGRTACLDGLDLEAAELEPTERGLLAVGEAGRTSVPHIYGAGDVVGPPALATAAMEQGRRAVRHALGLGVAGDIEAVPAGIYTVPEIGCIGLTEAAATERYGGCVVGRADFGEIARGQINGEPDGFLKLVVDPRGERLLGAHVLGSGATELVHLAQLCLLGGGEVDVFVDNVFNFPTLAEAYRVAALDVVGRRARKAA